MVKYTLSHSPPPCRNGVKGLAFSGMFPSSEKDIGKALLKLLTENI
jgi:hypothetical protein